MSAVSTEFLEEIREIDQRKPDALTWSSTIIDFVADFFKISAFFTTLFTILSNTSPEPNEQGEHEPEALSILSWQVILALVFAAAMTPGTAYANMVINTSGQSSENTTPVRTETQTLEVEGNPLIESKLSSAELRRRNMPLLILSYLGETFNMEGGFLLTFDLLYSIIFPNAKLTKLIIIISFALSLIPSAVANYAITRTAANNSEEAYLESESEEAATEDKNSEADFFTNARAVVHFLSDFLPSTVFFSTLLSLAEKTTDLDDGSTGQEDNFEIFAWTNILGAALALLLTTANVAADWFVNKQGQSKKTPSTAPQNIQAPPFESSANSASERSSADVCALALLLGLSYCSELSETAGVYWLIQNFLAKLISPHWNMDLSVSLALIFGDIVLGAIKATSATRTAKTNIENALEHSSSTFSCSAGRFNWFSRGSASSQASLIPSEPPSYAARCFFGLSSAASSTSSYIGSVWQRCARGENGAPPLSEATGSFSTP